MKKSSIFRGSASMVAMLVSVILIQAWIRAWGFT